MTKVCLDLLGQLKSTYIVIKNTVFVSFRSGGRVGAEGQCTAEPLQVMLQIISRHACISSIYPVAIAAEKRKMVAFTKHRDDIVVATTTKAVTTISKEVSTIANEQAPASSGFSTSSRVG